MNMSASVALFFFVVLLLYRWYAKSFQHWRVRGIPYEPPHPFFGSLYDSVTQKEHVYGVFGRMYNKFKDHRYFGIFMFNRPLLLVKDPQLIKRMLVTDFDKFRNHTVPENTGRDPIIFQTLFALKDVQWKHMRSKITPVFTSGKLKLMVPLMRDCGRQFQQYLDRHEGQVIDVRLACKKFMIDMIASCAFGIDANCCSSEKQSKMFRMAGQIMDPTSAKRGFSVFCFLFVPKLFHMLRLNFMDQQAANYLVQVFKESYRERTRRNIQRNDLIDLLHTLNKEEGLPEELKFSDLQMATQALSFFSAGNDTSSVIIAFTLYELAFNPGVRDRLRAEIHQYDEITYDTLKEMKYLDMVVAEILRKRPVGTFLVRTANVDYTYEETGLVLEKGTEILVPIGSIHNDEDYFPNPDVFDPERFNEENRKNIKPFTFIPFGEGPRRCLGERFSMLNVKVGLIFALRDFDFDICDETMIPLEYDKAATMFLQPKNNQLFMRVTRVAQSN